MTMARKDPTLPFPRVMLTGQYRPACFQYALTVHPTRHRREARWVAKVEGFPMATIALCPGCLKVAKQKGKVASYRAITDEERDREVARVKALPPVVRERHGLTR